MSCRLSGLFILLFSFVVGAQESEYGLCSLTEENRLKIESCQRKMNSKTCEALPADMKKDCFSEFSQEEFSFVKSCAVDGTKKFVTDTYEGFKNVAFRAYSALTENKTYRKRIKDEAQINCSRNSKVLAAEEKYFNMRKNIGPERAYEQFGQEYEFIKSKCIHDEERTGQNLGVAFDFPDLEELTATLSCMSSDAQTEFGCSAAVPALATGSYAGVRALLKLRTSRKIERQLALTGNEFEKYTTKVKNKLSPAEISSLKHQEDLIEALNNPEIARRAGLSDSELKNLTQGIIDSDAGKLSSYKTYLTSSSAESDQLFNVIKGVDNQTPAGRSFQQFMTENAMAEKGLLNKNLSNDEIRKLFSEAPVAQGYLHELPGLTEAIKDVNSGKITGAEFKKRLGANLFHNGPQAGFWDFLTTQVVPNAMKETKYNNFFKNTAFEYETTATGFVKPRYPAPVSKEGFIHTTFDRLSQATSGGNKKIFLELHNGVLKDNPKLKLGELKGPSGNGIGTLKNLLIGDGKSVASNALKTTEQFAALTEAVSKSSKLSLTEKIKLKEIIRASRDRTLAFDDYMKKFSSFENATDGSVSKITLKDSNGNYLGLLTKDTPADEAQQLLEKFYAKEENFNGHPIKDLMKSRVLTKTEIVAYGKASALSYFYCNSQKFKNGKAVETGAGSFKKLSQPPKASATAQ